MGTHLQGHTLSGHSPQPRPHTHLRPEYQNPEGPEARPRDLPPPGCRRPPPEPFWETFTHRPSLHPVPEPLHTHVHPCTHTSTCTQWTHTRTQAPLLSGSRPWGSVVTHISMTKDWMLQEAGWGVSWGSSAVSLSSLSCGSRMETKHQSPRSCGPEMPCLGQNGLGLARTHKTPTMPTPSSRP